MINIEIQAYVNDHLSTYAIMQGEGDKLQLLTDFIDIQRLRPEEPLDDDFRNNNPSLSGMPDPKLSINKYDLENHVCLEGICNEQIDDVHVQFVAFLEKRGFKRLETESIRFSD